MLETRVCKQVLLQSPRDPCASMASRHTAAVGAQALAKYAFGLGFATMAVTALVFMGMGLPPGHGLGTEILVRFFHAVRASPLAGVHEQMCYGLAGVAMHHKRLDLPDAVTCSLGAGHS